MAEKLRVGQTLTSAVDSTALIVVRAPESAVQVTCGGVPMSSSGSASASAVADPALQGGTLLGKRYVDEGSAIELLCTKAGSGTVAVDGTPLVVQGAKPLPASD